MVKKIIKDILIFRKAEPAEKGDLQTAYPSAKLKNSKSKWTLH